MNTDSVNHSDDFEWILDHPDLILQQREDAVMNSLGEPRATIARNILEAIYRESGKANRLREEYGEYDQKAKLLDAKVDGLNEALEFVLGMNIGLFNFKLLLGPDFGDAPAKE